MRRRSNIRFWNILIWNIFLGLLLAAIPLHATDPPPPGAGAAMWATQGGSVDRGIAYPLARWRSLLQADRIVELDALVGVDGAGAGISRELYVGEMDGRRTSVNLGLGAVLPYSAARTDAAEVVVYGVLRLGRKEGD